MVTIEGNKSKGFYRFLLSSFWVCVCTRQTTNNEQTRVKENVDWNQSIAIILVGDGFQKTFVLFF